MQTTNATDRNRTNGQYAHTLEKVCTCGATKGAHLAEAPYDLEENDCPGFKLARKAK